MSWIFFQYCYVMLFCDFVKCRIQCKQYLLSAPAALNQSCLPQRHNVSGLLFKSHSGLIDSSIIWLKLMSFLLRSRLELCCCFDFLMRIDFNAIKIFPFFFPFNFYCSSILNHLFGIKNDCSSRLSILALL